MKDLKPIIKNLEEKNWYNGQIEHTEVLPRKDPEYEEAILPPKIKRYLEEKDTKLYSHQARAINLVKEENNVIITTPTASGKTLAFNIPILSNLMKNKEARALYIYPTKALSNDQLKTLEEMEEQLDLDIKPAVYDGDTPRHVRPRIRRESRIILTNPYGLHYYLPWHHKWRKVFKNLEYVVMDEVHQYRGVFGSNIALLMRRFARICDHYGSEPQFILSSATIANPSEFSKKLIGKKCKVVANDGSATGKKYFVFWNPVENPEESIHVQTSEILSYMVDQGLQTLCFTISRRMAELVAKWSSKKTNREIRAYKAGYMPEERREIERGFRNGKIRGVASTNALEVGIDIGGLDVVLISGYPGTVISTWQQAGRAGRGREESSAFLLGFENPLDQYFMKHPKRFFEKSHEHAVVDLENPYISMGHALCASNELPVKESEEFFGKYEEEVENLEKERLIQKTPAGYIFSGTRRPSEFVKLNNIREETIKVVNAEGEVFETMDRNQAYREAHEGAILLHQGETYIVKNLDLEEKRASVRRREVDYYTEAMSLTDLDVLQRYTSRMEQDVKIAYGKVRVSEHYVKYKMKRYDKIIGVNSLTLPPINFETESTWLEIPESIIKKVEKEGLDVAGGLHALEHAFIAMTPFHALCDRWDIGGVSSPLHRDTESATIFIYDSYEGGIGISEKCFDLIKELLQTTFELIKDCDCKNGCPSCIYSPKCGNNNEPLDKQAAIKILDELLERASSSK